MILTCTRLYTCMVYTLYTGIYTIYMTIKTCTVPLCICIWCILYTIRAFKTSRQLLEFCQLLQVSLLATSRTITNTCQQTNSKSYNVLQNGLFALEISNDGFPCSNIIYSIVKYFVSSYIDFTRYLGFKDSTMSVVIRAQVHSCFAISFCHFEF